MESRAVVLALAHVEAWTCQDFETVRGNLAEDVQGLTQFARQVVPGSLQVMGPIGSKRFPSAQIWLLDDNGKMKVERITSYVAPRED